MRKSIDKQELEKLRARLATSAAFYQTESLEFQRKAVLGALFAVQDFLEAQDFPPETLQPILRPALALMEREHNNLDQMFAQRARAGRPRATLDRQERTGVLASFANAWLRIHHSDMRPQGSKLRDAATTLRGGWFGDVTAASLKSARETVSQEANNHPAVVIASVFDDLFEQAFAIASEDDAFNLVRDYVNEAPAARMKGISKTP